MGTGPASVEGKRGRRHARPRRRAPTGAAPNPGGSRSPRRSTSAAGSSSRWWCRRTPSRSRGGCTARNARCSRPGPSTSGAASSARARITSWVSSSSAATASTSRWRGRRVPDSSPSGRTPSGAALADRTALLPRPLAHVAVEWAIAGTRARGPTGSTPARSRSVVHGPESDPDVRLVRVVVEPDQRGLLLRPLRAPDPRRRREAQAAAWVGLGLCVAVAAVTQALT